ncbi:MAG: DUF371 domain-containing protein [Candidatus Aenigmarchaeota archaeon]|nr:DUF371 domain-containing protein [Candidatus Aenigmarchaeota archaeon]
MKKEVKEMREIEPELPAITPEMIRTTFEALEAKGMVFYTETGAYIPTERGWKLLMEIKPVKEEIIAYGHVNITATHKTTFEITKASEIRKDADCIIGVRANKACKDLSKEIKDALKEGKRVEIKIQAGGVEDTVIAYGSPALKLNHAEDIVVRKSDFIDNRTLAILANKSACDLKRELIEKLKNPETEVKIIIEVK